MNARMRPVHSILVAVSMMACVVSASAAETTKSECPPLTKETREKMAAVHEQIAACLRSDKPVAECRAEMAKSHSELMQASGCPHRKMHPHMDKHSNMPDQK